MNNSEKALNRITKSRVELMLDFPFFGVLALSLKLKEDENINTAGTDGKNLYYNSEFINKLTDEELNWLIIHELLHPVLGHLWRKENRLHVAWNVACDYALHNIMMELMEQNYNSRNKLSMPENGLYDKKYKDMSAEQIYDKLDIKTVDMIDLLDDHDVWGQSGEGNRELAEEWAKRIVEASIASRAAGNLPAGLEKIIKNLINPKKNWRILLHEFVEREVSDYSFNPPDRRFNDYEFFMPDFNEEDETVKNIIFLIDTSGSVNEDELQEFYSELVGAVNQFSRLEGKLGFFDHECYGLSEFVDKKTLMEIKPVGGGGTSFTNALEYVKDNTEVDDVAGIVIFTDGYSDFPDESITRGVPTLWVITGNSSVEPPWGAYTKLEDN